MIDVRLTKSADPCEFDVAVRDRGTQTRHRVTMTAATYSNLAGEAATPERVIKAAFAFLLDREPKESILSSFDVTVIGKYFPSFENEIASYL